MTKTHSSNSIFGACPVGGGGGGGGTSGVTEIWKFKNLKISWKNFLKNTIVYDSKKFAAELNSSSYMQNEKPWVDNAISVKIRKIFTV